jgi:hypothetical protein
MESGQRLGLRHYWRQGSEQQGQDQTGPDSPQGGSLVTQGMGVGI